MSLVKPKFYIPLHGEQKHLNKHALLAQTMGVPKENTLIANIGDVIEVSNKAVKVSGTVPSGRVLVDGLGVGDVGGVVLRDRKHLADDGIIIVTVTIDSATGEVVAGPEIVSRGFVYVKESEQLIKEITEVAEDILEYCYIHRIRDWNSIKLKLRDGISKHLYGTTRRSPMVLPIIMEV
jgi:ribonuclease J